MENGKIIPYAKFKHTKAYLNRKKRRDDKLLQEKENKEIVKSPPPEIIKNIEYSRLIEMIRDGKFTSTMLTAKALGISQSTVLSWIKTPEIQQIAQDQVDRYVSKMEVAGKNDWKMWHQLLKYTIRENEQGAVNNGNIINVYIKSGQVGVIAEGDQQGQK